MDLIIPGLSPDRTPNLLQNYRVYGTVNVTLLPQLAGSLRFKYCTIIDNSCYDCAFHWASE